MKNFTKEMLLENFDIHLKYVNDLIIFNKKYECKTRMPNFPEHLSENIIMHILINKTILKNTSRECSGDLKCDNLKIECKTTTSEGPISFGPDEHWDILYILDAPNWKDDKFMLYEIKLSDMDDIIKNIPVNKKESFNDQRLAKKRPRISWVTLKKYLNNNAVKIFDGKLSDIFDIKL